MNRPPLPPSSTHPLLLELEGIERNAWADLIELMPARLAQEIGLQSEEIHHALFLMAARIPQFQFNWLSGTGLNGDEGSAIHEAVRRFRAAGQRKFIIQIPPGPNASRCEEQARAAGLQEHPLAWAKFYRTTESAPTAKTDLMLRGVRDGERDLFAATATAGFGMPAAMAPWLAQLVGREHWHTYLSFAGDQPVGAAALYVRGDFAWLGVGATRPELRRRGSQSALLALRLAEAARLGARHATTETGVPQSGQPAPSYSNILRAGFAVAYVRPNWSEPP